MVITKDILVSFIVLAALTMMFWSTVSYARDYDYGCPIRNPRAPVTEKELGKYIKHIDFIFEGKPIKRGISVVGLKITTFKVKAIHKGEMPEKGILKIVHLPEMFTDMEGTYFIRAQYADDGNLYPNPLACPKYYSDEELLNHMKYLWSNFLIGCFMLIIGVLLCLRFIKFR